jgi:uncharacterized membrane protein
MWCVRSTVFLLLVLPTAACDPGACPEESTVSWADVEPLFTENCTSCHSSELSGDDRLEAPEAYNYDTMEAAQAHPNWTWAEIKLGHMPPSGALSQEEQELVREWLACR